MTTEELQTLLDAATLGDWTIDETPGLGGRHDVWASWDAIVCEDARLPDARAIATWPAIAAELIAARAKLAAAEGLVAATLKFREFAADHSMTSEVMPFDNLAARELSAALTAWEAVK